MKAIIIGASSGIGKSLAEELHRQAYTIGITARRTEKLEALQQSLVQKSDATQVYIQSMDVTQYEHARTNLADLADVMGGVDIIVINAGIGWITKRWENELQIINTNVTGFAAIANWAFNYFRQQGQGHIVGISSVASERGGAQIPAYHASKAFISNYMEGLRCKSISKKLNITVTDIRPGFVATPMTEQNTFMFWVSTAEKAARQIRNAIERKKSVAYISRRWVLVAWLMRQLPTGLYAKLTG